MSSWASRQSPAAPSPEAPAASRIRVQSCVPGSVDFFLRFRHVRCVDDLPERKRKVLYAVVHDFIMSAEPVGSTQVAKKKGINLSPATVRTVMAELEERGFLGHPHPSAGRIPTDAGYRFYVDQLMKLRPLSHQLSRWKFAHELRPARSTSTKF